MGWGEELGRRGRVSSSIGERAGEKWGTTSVGDMGGGTDGVASMGLCIAEEAKDTKRRV